MASNTVSLNTYKAILLAKTPSITVGATSKTFDGTTSISFSMNEIMGTSTNAYFYRGDKTWSNTIIGPFNASSSGTARANINMVTVADQPNDFYLGNNNANKWSITSRASNESYNLNVYSTASGIGYCTRWEYSTGKFLMLHGAEVSGGYLVISQPDDHRDYGLYGTYKYTKAATIWSMGTAYKIAADGSGLGSLYGAAYAYQDQAYIGSKRLAGGHQFLWCENGGIDVALGSNGVWIKKGGGIYWDPYIESASDASDVTSIYQIASGVAGGTELRINQQNDAADCINLCTNSYIYLNSKRAFTINDSWLRINENLGFSSGIYTGSSLIRSDNQIQVGSAGANFLASTSQTKITTMLSVVNNSSNNGNDALVYIECKTANDWGLKINKGGTAYGIYVDALDKDPAIQTNGYIRGRCIWANQGSNGERQVGVDSKTSGTLYLWSNTTDKGLYSSSGYSTGYVIQINGSGKHFYGTDMSLTGNLTVNSSNTTGGGIILSDDGDIVDLNDAYCSMRFTYGVRIFSANKGGSATITLASGGNITASALYPSGSPGSNCYFGAGNGDGNGSGTANIVIRSWYGVGFMNGCTAAGTNGAVTAGVDCRSGHIYANAVHNAVWNDYAECRKADIIEGGYCVTETPDGSMMKTTERLQPGCKLTSDTYGSIMGETDEAKTPIAVAGRVLVYPYHNRNDYPLGAAVCSAPNGTIDIMTRDEIIMYPERIVGTVSEIPTYTIWRAGGKDTGKDIEVNGRIWVYVK